MDPVRLLIVDDERELVSALVERLDLRGFVAEGVFSGEAALEKVRTTPFDVVILDLKMPGMGGLETTEMLLQERPEVKVILLTGHGAVENAEKGKECGAFDCLMKPISIDVLIDVVNRAAGRSEGSR